MYNIESLNQLFEFQGFHRKPVSYTHLDVYKRQGEERPGDFTDPAALIELTHPDDDQ